MAQYAVLVCFSIFLVYNGETITIVCLFNSYLVQVIEVDSEHDRGGRDKNKYIPADVYLMRDSTSGFGSDTQFHCRSHLGRVLHPGDTVLGFDFTTANINDDNIGEDVFVQCVAPMFGVRIFQFFCFRYIIYKINFFNLLILYV